MNNNPKPLYEQAAERLIDLLERGISPLQQRWNEQGSNYPLPFNPTTGKPYRGLNSFWLMSQKREDGRWMTFKQAQTSGWKVNTGEKGVLINYFSEYEQRKARDKKGNVILEPSGKPKMQRIKHDSPVMVSSWVFNAEQMNGIPPWETVKETQGPDIGRIKGLLEAGRVQIDHQGDEAFYNPVNDRITLPNAAQFGSAAMYYATALHELVHWTGHKSRLNRGQLDGPDAGKDSRETLRAGIASLMLGATLNISHDFTKHAAYVKDWVALLKTDPFEIHRASDAAQHIHNYIMAFERRRNVRQGQGAESASRPQEPEQAAQAAVNRTAAPKPWEQGEERSQAQVAAPRR